MVATLEAGPAGLTIVTAPTGLAAQRAADEAMAALGERGARATRICVDDASAKRTARRLAGSGTLVLGDGTTTLAAWALGRWALFGDGRTPVTAAQRRALMIEACDLLDAPGAPRDGSGAAPSPAGPRPRDAARLAEALESSASGTPSFDNPSPAALAGLDAARRAVIDLCRAYEGLLDRRGRIEPGRATGLLPSVLSAFGWEHLVLEGAAELTPAQEALLVQAALHAGVTVCVRASEPGSRAVPALAKADALLGRLADLCARAGAAVTWRRAQGDPSPWESAELAALAGALFRAGESEALRPAGDVRFVLPAGRYAQAEAVAREVERLCLGEGMAPRDIILTCADPLATAEGLEGRLAARGIACLSQGTEPVERSLAGRALLGLQRLVEEAGPAGTGAALSRAADERRRESPDAAPLLAAGVPAGSDAFPPAPRLRPLASDLARNPLLAIAQQAALRLDRAWRRRRLASAADMLAGLACASPRARDALACLAGADVPGALAALRPPDPAGPPVSDDALQRNALGSLEGRLREAVAAWGPDGARRLSLDTLSRLVDGMSARVSRLSVPPQALAAQHDAAVLASNPNAVRVMTMRDALGQRARAVIACDLTADLARAEEGQDAAAGMLAALGLSPRMDGLADLRWRFSAVLEAASERLVLERPLADADGNEMRPSMLFEEVVDCYRPDITDPDDLDRRTGLPKSGALPCDQDLGEGRADDLSSPLGPLDRAVTPCPAPQVCLRRGVSSEPLLREGDAISPTSLERYLRCPLRWLYERRLPADGIDATLGAAQSGNVAHEALCLFHRRMPEALGVGRITPEVLEERGRLVDELADACFDEALAANRGSVLDPRAWGGRDTDPLRQYVPVTPLERRDADSLRGRVRACVRRDALLPEGYVPARHEWTFGGRDDEEPAVPYAGALLTGRVDRVDVGPDGGLLVIDYKGAIGRDYELAPRRRADTPDGEEPPDGPRPDDVMPLHTQIFMYARALERGPHGAPVNGVAYVSYRRREARPFLRRSAFPDLPADGLFDPERSFPEGRRQADGFEELLDLVEKRCEAAVGRMRDGDIAPDPRFGAQSCADCPLAATCERRAS